MLKERQEVPAADCWNVEDLYPTFAAWEKEFNIVNKDQQPRWPELAAFRGKLGDSPESLKAALDKSFAIERQLSRLYTYAHLRHDENITDDTHKGAISKIMSLIHDFQEEAAWFEPELLALPDDKLKALLNSKVLSEYRFHLEKIVRVKAHVLTFEKEELLALAEKPLQSVQKAFRAINDADFKFGDVLDSKGKKHPLTHGSYGLYMRDHDRTLRKNAYLKLHNVYNDYENTLCELLQGQVQAHLFQTRARKYSSCLDAALFPKNIDTSVYHALIQAVHDKMDVLHKYIGLRKRIQDIEGGKLHLYDMQVPLTADIEIDMPYQEAEDVVIASVAPLGSDYQNVLSEGLKNGRWVDRYENKNKRSGAYSSGCYDSMPYILMNYRGTLRDVFTLAHEIGHSMHSLLTHQNQPYQYGNYPIFLAEVASTFNEDLLIRLLLERTKSKEEKIYMLTQKIEDIRSTLFRQTMFAEFELFVHEMAEQGVPLTPKLMREKYRKLNELYFGDNVKIDAEADAEWSRIPHFYYNFYVYQYATGISAALALAEKVVSGGNKEREAYLGFLKSGNSKYPIDILADAGVDMRSPQPVQAAIAKFGKLVDELDLLLKV
jgi:oligoendopeptidase F